MNIEIIKNSESQYDAYILDKDVPTVSKFLTEEIGCTILKMGPGGEKLSFGPKLGLKIPETRQPLTFVKLSNPIGDEIVDKISRKYNLRVLIREDKWILQPF